MLALFGNKVFAQQNLYSDRKLITTAKFDLKKYDSNKNKAAGVYGEWFNYGNAINALGTSTAVLNSNYLFPDSLAYGEFGAGNFAPCWIHHLGDVLDVETLPFTSYPPTMILPKAGYFIDSMALVYRYTRNHPNPAIVDTLVVTLFTNATPTNLLSSIITGSLASNHGTDTISYQKIKYNQAINTVSATSVYWFKVLLKMGDTADIAFREKAFRLTSTFVVPTCGKLLVSDIQFKPGYTYALGDHIDYVANSFFFASLEEKGISTFPNYYDCNAGSSSCDWNSSSIVTSQVRYNMTPTWNGYFIPSYANPASYPYEHHLISYRLTQAEGFPCSGLSIPELEINNFTLGQNIPNPFNSGSSISYELINEAKYAILTITDVMGRLISSEQTAHIKGIHTINIKQFVAGVYYYSLNVDGNVITKKMIAQ